MEVERTTTGLIIHNPSDTIKRKCLQYFSLTNPIREYFLYSGNDPDKKPIFGKDKDVIYITSGFLNVNDPDILYEIGHIKTIQPPIGKKVEITMNRQPRSKLQEDCISAMMNSKQNKVTVELKPGVGKMQPYSTKIPTPTRQGYTLMGDLKVGDYVFDRTGKPTQILQIFEHGIRDVYKITFKDGRTSLCGLDHLWSVYVNNDTSKYVTMDTRDIVNGMHKGNKYSVPLCEPVQYDEKPYAFCCFSDGDPSERMMKSRKLTYLHSSPTRMQEFIDRFTKPGTNQIHVDPTCIEYAKETVLPILYAMGYSAYIDDECIVHYSKPDSLEIMSIKYSHREMCRCIMVDNPEHLYLTEDYIVTHNTFIALYSTAKLGLKPLIVTPSTLLKNQWIENLTDMGIEKSTIATNIFDAPNRTFCVVTITSIETAIRDNWQGLVKAIDESQFGIKIIDEAHLHLKGMLKFDALCNIKYNWYLSATLGRSDASEDRILNRALSDAERFVGDSKYEEYQKQYVEVYFQDIYYNPPLKLCNEYFKYGSKGLIRSTYYNMLLHYQDGKPFINNIITMIKRAKGIVSEGKILVLVPLLEIIARLEKELMIDPEFRSLSISGVDGGMNIGAKRQALESDIILSTSMSMGVGVDVSNLAAVINFDQYSSPIITEQIFGRLRDRGKITHYFDICDYIKYAKTLANWGRKRRILIPYFPGANPEVKILPKISC